MTRREAIERIKEALEAEQESADARGRWTVDRLTAEWPWDYPEIAAELRDNGATVAGDVISVGPVVVATFTRRFEYSGVDLLS